MTDDAREAAAVDSRLVDPGDVRQAQEAGESLDAYFTKIGELLNQVGEAIQPGACITHLAGPGTAVVVFSWDATTVDGQIAGGKFLDAIQRVFAALAKDQSGKPPELNLGNAVEMIACAVGVTPDELMEQLNRIQEGNKARVVAAQEEVQAPANIAPDEASASMEAPGC